MTRSSDPVMQAVRGALGAALSNPKAADVVLTGLSPDDLPRDTDRRVLGVMRTLHSQGEPVDAVSVLAAMNGQGGSVDLTEYVTDVPSERKAEHYVGIIRREAERQRTVQRLEAWTGQLKSGTNPEVVKAQLAKLGLETNGAASDRAVSGGSFILDVPDEAPAVWGDGPDVAWAAGEPLYLVGQVGVGKTTVAQQLLLRRIGLRDPEFLGMEVESLPDDGRVLYLAMDRPKQIARSMRRMVSEEDRAVLDERATFWEGPLPFDLGAEPERLTMMARNYGATDVIVDSLKDAAFKLSEDETGARVNSSFQHLVADGRQVVVLHHQRKSTVGNSKPDSLDDVYGSRWLSAGAGSVLCLWGAPGDPVVALSHLKQVSGEVGPARIIHDHTEGATRLYESVSVYDIVKAARNGITTRDVARHLFGGIDVERNQIEKARRKLKNLENKGHVHRRPGETGGDGGATPDRWFATTAIPESPV